jgi:hypothetical protein
MVLVLFILFAWFCIHVHISLQHKLPLIANFLIYFAISIILINKLTLVGYNFGSFKISTDLPAYLSLILHNDFTIPFVLLTFANVFLTTSNAGKRWAITVYTFFIQLLLGRMLQEYGVLTYSGWNILSESGMIILVMAYTLVVGKLAKHMSAKEGWIR